MAKKPSPDQLQRPMFDAHELARLTPEPQPHRGPAPDPKQLQLLPRPEADP